MQDQLHLSEELKQTGKRVTVTTRFGKVTGGRALNGAAAFLEVPYALPPKRFENPVPLPNSYQYEDKEYVHENSYGVQPVNDGQAESENPENKLGLGRPTENPLFLNIVVPPSFPEKNGFPVKIYIHGGYLQFGSPHGLSSQAQFVAAEREEIYVNPGYRLSAFGFLASDEPAISGNFGFKDQWLALEWVRDNIAAFGGDPSQVCLTGLSAGAHSVHQLLHHVTRLPPGIKSPFQRAFLQSNAIIFNPKTPAELRAQYNALLESLDIDPSSESSLSTLKDPTLVPWERICKSIETLVAYGTFRGTSDGNFLPDGEMEWQSSGGFAKVLEEKGVLSIVVGDLTEEWYVYSLSDPIEGPADMEENLRRYYTDDIVTRMLNFYEKLPINAGKDEYVRLYGQILSDGQVHLPVRLLHRDLHKHGFPVLRYEIRWTPPQVRRKGYVTHGTDRPFWAFRANILTPDQMSISRLWLNAIDLATKEAESGPSLRPVDEVLTLKEDGKVAWTKDTKWKEMERLAQVVENTKESSDTKL
ncbi:carboxylesterase [Gautieria morchelliformis]|nr:carboxylesterase [Gautieria morchelliformis]